VLTGPKPKPIEQRRREGNPGKRPLPEPVVIGGRAHMIEPPEDMPDDAKEAWNQIVPVLADAGILDVVDQMALEAMCVVWSRAKQARRVIAEDGPTSLGSTGQLVDHPAVATEKAAVGMFLRFAEQFGLTPVARTRLGFGERRYQSMQTQLEATLGDVRLRRVK
jgi:P27 family predicted phage terminase small subunit